MDNILFDKSLPNRIKSVVINDFRGISYQHQILNGNHFNLKGKNETYKTTFLEAIVWALRGKLMDDTSKVENVTPYGKPTDTETSVEIEFESGIKIKRTYQRKKSINRETGESYYNAPTQTIYVDEVKQQSLESGQAVIYNELGLTDALRNVPQKIDLFMLLLVPRYIKLVDSKVMRELFESIVGEPNLSDVLKTYPKEVLAEFAKYDYKLDTVKSIHDKAIKLNNATVEIHQTAIKKLEQEQASQSNEVVNVKELEKQKETLEAELLDLKLKEKQSGGELVKDLELKIKEKEQQLYKLSDEFSKKQNEFISKREMKLQELDKQYKGFERQQLEIQRKIEVLRQQNEQKQGTITNFDKDILQFKQLLKDLKVQFDEVMTPTFVTAPISKERFDIYQSEEMKPIRDKKLVDIKQRGKTLNGKVDETSQLKVEIENEIELNLQEIEKLESELVKTKTNLAKISNLMKEEDTKFHNNEEIADLRNVYKKEEESILLEIKSLENEIRGIKQGNQNNSSNITFRIGELERQVKDVETQIRLALSKRDYKSEIKTLLDTVNGLRNDVAFSEKVIVFVKKVERDKLVALESQVAKHFGDDIQIKLFDITLEDTIKPIFDILVKDKNGDFTSIFTAINNGAFDYQVVRLTNMIRKFFGVRISFVLIDEISYIGNDNLNKLLNLGQQVISSEVEK